MKKTYIAPEILFESFTMSTNIAGDCEAKPDTQANYDSCGKDFSGLVVFLQGYNGCSSIQVGVLETDLYDGICYHVPTDANNLFTS